MNRKLLLTMTLIAIGGGYIFNNYGVPGSIVLIPIVFPMVFSVLSLKCGGREIFQYVSGLLVLALFDSVRWLAWVTEVGKEFAISDEQTYGISAATVAIHFIIFSVSFVVGLLLIRKQAKTSANKHAV
jgi:hypothetical protein